jgi:hypothetical protein
MEAAGRSEKLVTTYMTTRYLNPGDNTSLSSPTQHKEYYQPTETN